MISTNKIGKVMWVSIQQISKMYTKPERTLRHYAAQGKIIVRKKNRSWECDLASVEKLGWARSTFVGEIKSQAGIPTENTNGEVLDDKEIGHGGTSQNPSNEIPKEKKKFVLSNLGIYNELLSLTKKIKQELKNSEAEKNFFESAFKSIQCIGYGFYTYDRLAKVQYFSQARNHLINLLLQIEVNGQEAEGNAVKKQLEESIIPGIGGLIRRAEKSGASGRKYDQNSRSSDITKN